MRSPLVGDRVSWSQWGSASPWEGVVTRIAGNAIWVRPDAVVSGDGHQWSLTVPCSDAFWKILSATESLDDAVRGFGVAREALRVAEANLVVAKDLLMELLND